MKSNKSWLNKLQKCWCEKWEDIDLIKEEENNGKNFSILQLAWTLSYLLIEWKEKFYRNCETLMKPFNGNSMKCKQTNPTKRKESKKKNGESLGKLL